MKAIVMHFAQDAKGDTIYENDKPKVISTLTEFPLRLRYGSYNEPKKLFVGEGYTICDVDDIVSIDILKD